MGSTIKADSPRDGAWRNQPSQSHQGGLRSRSRRGVGRAWAEEGKGRVASAGPGTHRCVRESAPDTKGQGLAVPSAAWSPWCQGGGHISSFQPFIASPAPPPPCTPAVCTTGRGLGHRVPDPLRDAQGGATEHPPRPPAPIPGLPSCGHDPLPSQARSLGRAARGSAWRLRGARRRRVPYPWRPEEAAVCAARRTKRGAPLPAIVRQRPPAERAGDPGGRGTPSRRQPRPDLHPPPPRKGPRLRGFPAPGTPLDAGGRGARR